VGGGLPPLAGRRSEIAVGVAGDTVSVPLRLVIGDHIQGAGRAPSGASTAMPFGPFPAGWVDGYVETDPDELGADDRRWFALAVLPPPVVSVQGAAPFFLQQALAVLEESGRLRRGGERPDVVVALGGDGAEQARSGRSVIVVPEPDPDLLPALNRRLAGAGIPWRYQTAAGTGELHVTEHRLPLPLEQIRVARGYTLQSTGPGTDAEVLARLADGTPWLVRGRTGAGEYRLIGSPLESESSNLPMSASMVPLLEWLVSTGAYAQAGGARSVDAGTAIPVAASATAVRSPDGERHPVDPAQSYRATRQPGIYRVLAGDSVIDEVAVNPPLRESLLAPADPEQLRRALGNGARIVSEDSTAWAAEVFTTRLGAELWRPLLLAALLVLLVETGVAPSRKARAARPDLARSAAP
jgi:hypothetical protein